MHFLAQTKSCLAASICSIYAILCSNFVCSMSMLYSDAAQAHRMLAFWLCNASSHSPKLVTTLGPRNARVKQHKNKMRSPSPAQIIFHKHAIMRGRAQHQKQACSRLPAAPKYQPQKTPKMPPKMPPQEAFTLRHKHNRRPQSRHHHPR